MAKLTCPDKHVKRSTRRQQGRGAELVEFSLTFIPFLAFITVLISISWAIFAKSALQYAVKAAVRTGITINKEAAGTSDLTTLVKNLVKQNSFGFLKDTSLVQVHYYQPPLPGSTGSMTDVSKQTGANPGNSAGNVMVVSVNNFSLSPVIVRIFSGNSSSASPTTINVSSADLIEQISSSDLAPLGTAP